LAVPLASVATAGLLHKGGQADWTISREAVAFLAGQGGPDRCTLETGAGLSTIVLARQGGQHICVTPSGDEIARIQARCAEDGIDLGRVRFVCECSEIALPKLDLPPLDMVLIDGAHGFPLPQIDFYYTAAALKIGGLMVIDDAHIWSCAILVDYLREEPGWQLVSMVGRRTAVFRKLAEFHYQEFRQQPYVARRTRLAKLKTSALRSLDLLRAGDFTELRRRVLRLARARRL
jgi:predicted O-methyltransferase YrrM